MEVKGKYFCGNEISRYGQENGYVDYATLAKSFQHVLCNEIINQHYWDWYSGGGEEREVFQWYIISEQGARILKDWTDEYVLYNEDLNLYLWGVTHFGTAWDYVLTDIKCGKEEES